MNITDEFYSVLQGDEVQKHIEALSSGDGSGDTSELVNLLSRIKSGR